MHKRQFLVGAAAALAAPSWALDTWGEKAGFPTGWGPPGAQQKWEGYPEYHVGNFSGGLESMFAHRVIQASPDPSPLISAPRKIKANFFMDAADYANQFNRSGLLIARGSEIWHEQYRFNRSAEMRFFGWSMTKSVVGLLVGIALNEGKFSAVDDLIANYVTQLQGHAFADITLRNLLNMTSGIAICEAFCSPNTGFERYGYSQIGYSPRRGEGTDQRQGVMRFKWGLSDAPGTRFNYTDMCPLLMAWALESAYQEALPVIAEQKLWQPMGAQNNATWLTDASGFTFSGAGFSATLRDWARLGLLVAQHGAVQGRQLVPRAWLKETSQHSASERAASYGVARPQRGYKNFFWHHSADGQVLRMAGNHGQNILMDQRTGTVLVQAAPGYENGADEMMFALFKAACAL